jgi:hypothetical protein
MKRKNKWMVCILLALMGLNGGCAATRTGSSAGTDSHSSVVAGNEKPLGQNYGAVSSSSAKEPPTGLDESSAGQSSTGNGTPPSNGSSTGDPMNQ